MPPQITCASALPGKTEKHENRIFTHCIAWIQPAVWFLQTFWLTTHTHDAVSSYRKSRNYAFSPQDCWRHGSGERKSRALHKFDCVARTVHQCAVLWVSYFTRYIAEALDRWGGKTKHRVISYFLSKLNTSAKNIVSLVGSCVSRL